MKRIAIFAPAICSYGGEQRVVTVIANELAKDNHVTIFKCDKGEPCYDLNTKITVRKYFQYDKTPLKRILRFIDRKKKPKFFEKHNSIYRYIYYSKNSALKMKQITENEFDIVIAVSGHLSIILGFAKKNGLQCETIGWEHNSYEAYFQTPNKYLWKRDNIFIEAASYLDHCVVLNEDIAYKYHTNLGISCDVIYNPRSFISKEKSSLKQKLFVACGRFVEAKGFDLLIKAFSEYSKYGPEWKLMLIGDGELRQTIEKQVRDEGLENRVIFTGFINDVREKMMNASIYLLPSRWEGFPMCVTEAFEVGLPIISFGIPAVLPLMKNGEGIEVEAYNTQKFALAMLKLASSYELRKEMAANAIRTADTLAVENIGDKWRNLMAMRKEL